LIPSGSGGCRCLGVMTACWSLAQASLAKAVTTRFAADLAVFSIGALRAGGEAYNGVVQAHDAKALPTLPLGPGLHGFAGELMAEDGAFGHHKRAGMGAGSARLARLLDMTEADWDGTIDLCLKDVFLCTRHEALRMTAGGL
jgi:NAD(P)-dependent dehydrogenase (short-subunit alcohol dehydrogenase family)